MSRSVVVGVFFAGASLALMICSIGLFAGDEGGGGIMLILIALGLLLAAVQTLKPGTVGQRREDLRPPPHQKGLATK
jgi:hypothetical protein